MTNSSEFIQLDSRGPLHTWFSSVFCMLLDLRQLRSLAVLRGSRVFGYISSHARSLRPSLRIAFTFNDWSDSKVTVLMPLGLGTTPQLGLCEEYNWSQSDHVHARCEYFVFGSLRGLCAIHVLLIHSVEWTAFVLRRNLCSKPKGGRRFGSVVGRAARWVGRSGHRHTLTQLQENYTY